MRPVVDAENDARVNWPPFFDRRDTELLEIAVGAAARDDDELETFLALLHAAYEQTQPLEQLYHELPGVFDGDADAADRFRAILDSMPSGVARAPLDVPDLAGFDFGRLPSCKPRTIVKPATTYALRLGVETVVHGDIEMRARYVDALRFATESAWIDSFYAHAAEPRHADDAGELGSELRGLAGRAEDMGRVELPGRAPNAGFRPCGMKEDLCRQLGLGALHIGGTTPSLLLPSSTYIDGLTGLSSSHACPGDKITLKGSFPPSKPAHVDVVVGSTVAKVLQWKDTFIEIEVPLLQGPRCVAFRDNNIEAERKEKWEKSGETSASAAGRADCGGPTELWTIPYVPGSAPCVGWNMIAAGAPTIVSFLVNGETITHIDPGEPVELSWQTKNAQSVKLALASGYGPNTFPSPAPLSGTANVGTFHPGLLIPQVAEYTLTAKNACGTSKALVSVAFSEEATLSISTIEIVQVVQTPAAGVRLVAEKRTMVRVSVDSGMRSGFQRIPPAANAEFVTGRAKALLTGVGAVVDAGPPINPGGVTLAQPPSAFNFNNLDDTLNFELPTSALFGTVQLEIDVFVPGHENAPIGRSHVKSSTLQTFHSQPVQHLRPMLIDDFFTSLPVPTMSDFVAVLPGAISRFPLPENAFVLEAPMHLVAAYTLGNVAGWIDMWAGLSVVVMLAPWVPGIAAGLVPNDPSYSPLGIAHGRLELIPALQISKAGDPDTFAHEMGHSFSVFHAPCGPIFSVTIPTILGPVTIGPEPGLLGTTDARGVDVAARTVIPAGASEIMSYCPAPKWSSTLLYESRVFDRVPVP